jgi:hypothetical protein
LCLGIDRGRVEDDDGEDEEDEEAVDIILEENGTRERERGKGKEIQIDKKSLRFRNEWLRLTNKRIQRWKN